MSKVIMPLLSGEVRGKIGDIVFQKRYGKTIARKRTIPSNPRTLKQVVVRTNLSGLSKVWKGENYTLKKYNPADQSTTDTATNGLSNTERQAWITYTTQTLKKPQAFARLTFIGINVKRLMNNQDINRTP
jgi:hypothetical protein